MKNHKKAVKYVLILAKLYIFYISKILEPFLTQFQENQHVIPFIYESIQNESNTMWPARHRLDNGNPFSKLL